MPCRAVPCVRVIEMRRPKIIMSGVCCRCSANPRGGWQAIPPSAKQNAAQPKNNESYAQCVCVCLSVCVVHSGAPSKTKLHMNGDASSGGRGEGKGDKNNPISMQILLYSSTFSRTFLHVSAGVPKNLFDYFHM